MVISARRTDSADAWFTILACTLPPFEGKVSLPGFDTSRTRRNALPSTAGLARAREGSLTIERRALMYRLRGRYLREAGRIPASIDAFQEAIRLNLRGPLTRMGLAKAYRVAKRFREADSEGVTLHGLHITALGSKRWSLQCGNHTFSSDKSISSPILKARHDPNCTEIQDTTVIAFGFLLLVWRLPSNDVWNCRGYESHSNWHEPNRSN